MKEVNFLTMKWIDIYITAICSTQWNIVISVPTTGNDPHFFIPLPNGDNLCYSVQVKPDLMFSLIKDKYVQFNAQFVLPASDENNTIANVSTFLGNLGLLLRCRSCYWKVCSCKGVCTRSQCTGR